MNNQVRKKVFVIGAGMSAEIGAPVISQFLSPPFINCVKCRKLNLVLEFISQSFPQNAFPNIEELLSLVDQAIVKKNSLAGYPINKLRKVRESLLYIIIEILAKTQDRLRKDFGFDKLDNPYAGLLSSEKEWNSIYTEKTVREMTAIIDRMKSNAYSSQKGATDRVKSWIKTYGLFSYLLNPEDTVITLNYDIFLDMGLSLPNLKWNIDYGIEFYELTSDLDIMCRGAPLWPINRPQRGRGEKIITVLKLHGALNWSICSACGEMIATVLTPITRLGRYICKLKKDPIDLKAKKLCCPNFNPEPFIVPPTWMKYYDNRYLGDIWGLAAQRLAEADIVVFLGYSFSPSDSQMRTLFTKARFNRNGQDWDEIVVVDKNIDRVLSNYYSFFDKVSCFSGTVSAYLQEIAKSERSKRKLPPKFFE